MANYNLQGGTSLANVEVHAASRAARVLLYDGNGNVALADPDDRRLVSYRSWAIGLTGGRYGFRTTTAIATTGDATNSLFPANAIIAAFYASPGMLTILRHVRLSCIITTAMGTAWEMQLRVRQIREITTLETGGTFVGPFNARAKSAMAPSEALFQYSTANVTPNLYGLVAGTRQIDLNGFGGTSFGTGTVLGTTPLPPTYLYGPADTQTGFPMMIGPGDGFVIENNDVASPIPAGGMRFGVDVAWIEVDPAKIKL